ncbi:MULTISPECIES: coniferyl aldehyde dehydrogenase [unclassified Pseudoalteromonas]|uniref:coniferyl aldehyde dehydrogenase n=1 Tax=unclassified Pseudoalteromonas TaxID=194690 RepID=UPI0030157058
MIEDSKSALIATHTRLKNEFNQSPYPSLDERKRCLAVVKSQLLTLRDEFVAAANEDFGSRSEFDTLIADIMPSVTAIEYIERHLSKWMRKQKRAAGMTWLPSKASVEVVPKGVVGVIAPWNYPIQLALVPAITALAAGNKVMIKLSEFTPQVNQIMRRLFTEVEGQVQIVEGGPEVAATFTELPFDHLIFTGSTAVGKKVMTAAAKNLTPVTLELGGKSPVLVLEDANIDAAATSILMGKLSNSGQICVAPDYLLVDNKVKDKLLGAMKQQYASLYQAKGGFAKQTSIINQAQFDRLQGVIADAEQKGATIWRAESTSQGRKLPLHIITEVSDDMQVMQEELFGPILPVVGVDSLDDAITQIRTRSTPLASYLFTASQDSIDYVSKNLATGTLGINETIVQVAVESLPFGGLGYSGMGQYHGEEGFYTFSHKKSILQSGNSQWRNKLLLTHSKWLTKPLQWLFLRG